MQINDRLIQNYLEGKDAENHWLYNAIVEGKHTYEKPDSFIKKDVVELFDVIKGEIYNFIPYNEVIYNALFPDWKVTLDNMCVLLAVGCPKPYDAMVREYNGEEYIIFDLIRLNHYKKQGYDVVKLIRGLITHESVHACLHKRYPRPKDESYVSKLKFIVFDEGFAHIVSYKDDIHQYDFEEEIDKYYKIYLDKLNEALLESDKNKQQQFLEAANSGTYWEKFGAIAGKLYLAQNVNHIADIYDRGVDTMMEFMNLK